MGTNFGAMGPGITPVGQGCWMAYYTDRSSFVPFATELEALRHAVGNGMAVRYAVFGDEDWMTGEPKQPPTSIWRAEAAPDVDLLAGEPVTSPGSP